MGEMLHVCFVQTLSHIPLEARKTDTVAQHNFFRGGVGMEIIKMLPLPSNSQCILTGTGV